MRGNLIFLCAVICSLMLNHLLPAQELSGPGEFVYEGYYTGQVMPTPKNVKSDGSFMPFANMKVGHLSASIAIDSNASRTETIAAQEVQNRIASLIGDRKDLPRIVNSSVIRDTDVVIKIGKASSDMFRGQDVLQDTPKQEQGYLLRCVAHGDKTSVLCVGRDEIGVYFAAQSLNQLLTRKGDQILLQRADIRDWPTFKVRSFKMGGKDYDMIREMGRWSAHFKWNCYNCCYTTIGADEWVNPSEDYRKLIEDLCKFAIPRGLDLMPFVNPYYLWKEHIQASDAKDIEALVETCKIGLRAGGNKVMLCLDDFASHKIPYTVISEDDKKKFGALAAVNCHIVTELFNGLRAEFPKAELFFVPPYYWIPRGGYQEQGEDYLREMGTAIPKEVTIVWTGPVVRSTTVTKDDVLKYTELIGRKPFLWDNTLYAHHNPPSYMLDAFTTKYPKDFYKLNEKGVHYNAGGGEIYKVGLITAADYLWNPDAYNPEESLRNAIAIVAGPEAVDPLLKFRDAYYNIYDRHATFLDSIHKLYTKKVALKGSPMDKSDIDDYREMVSKLQGACEEATLLCNNEKLVEQVKGLAAKYQKYLPALDWLEEQPALKSKGPAVNVARNPSAEDIEAGRPVGWNIYSGAGSATLAASDEAHSGQKSAFLKTTAWYVLNGRNWINCALVQGDSNGYTGANAYDAAPFTKYHFSFFLKGDMPKVEVSCVGWRGKMAAGDRQSLKSSPLDIAPTADWKRYEGWFITAPDTKKFALKIAAVAYEDEGMKLGSVYVDDVYIGIGRADGGK